MSNRGWADNTGSTKGLRGYTGGDNEGQTEGFKWDKPSENVELTGAEGLQRGKPRGVCSGVSRNEIDFLAARL